jgi:subtilase family serine protease
LDLEVRALADLHIEDILLDGASEPTQGDVVGVTVYVRNSGAVEATLVDVRLLADGALVGTGTIAIIDAGGLGSVTVDWRLPESDDLVVRLDAEVDRGATIDERDETNNLASSVVTVKAAPEPASNADDGATSPSAGATLGLTVLSLVAILGLFAAFAPKRVRKIE